MNEYLILETHYLTALIFSHFQFFFIFRLKNIKFAVQIGMTKTLFYNTKSKMAVLLFQFQLAILVD